MLKIFLFILCIICYTCSCKQSNHTSSKNNLKDSSLALSPVDTTNTATIFPPPEIGIKIVGYVLDFRKPAAISTQKLKQCNVVIYAFATLLPSLKLNIKYSENLASLSDRAAQNNCKILLGVNGAHASFKKMTANAANRHQCIVTMMQYIRQYKLNGIDMDWEFPQTSDKTDSLFTLFLKELSDSCHINGQYYLSSAVTPGVNGGRRSSAIRQELLTGNWVDWFNVMVYDDFSETKPYIHHSSFTMARTSFLYWLRTRKMQPQKCVMGLPFYGRPSGIPQNGLVRTYADILTAGGNAMRDSAIIKTDSIVVRNDTLTQYTIYYDGIKTIQKKTKGACRYGGGIMLWELGQDVNGKNSLLTAAVNTIKQFERSKTAVHNK